jgi:hypothetical protein
MVPRGLVGYSMIVGRKVRSLIVTRVGHNLDPTLAALEAAGLEPRWSWERIEDGAALPSALEAGVWDVLIYDLRCGISLDLVRASVERHAPALPIVIAASLDTLGADVKRALGTAADN